MGMAFLRKEKSTSLAAVSAFTAWTVLIGLLFVAVGCGKPAAKVSRDRTLVMSSFGVGGTELEGKGCNPYSLGGLGRIRAILNKTVFEFLYLYNHNTGEEIPWLAESYAYNDDFSKVTVTLRKGIEWSDGRPFTAKDIAFTLRMLLEHPALAFSGDIREWVKDVQVIDDGTAVLFLNRPNPRFFFTYFVENSEIQIAVLPEHVWKSEDVEQFANLDIDKGWPIGTGPYRLVNSTRRSQFYDRRDDWWAAKTGFQKLPAPERIVLVPPGAEASAAQRLMNNEFDVGPVLLKGTFETVRAKNPDVVSWSDNGPIWGAPDACLLSIGMNNKIPPFDDRDVRWALNHAIDRDRIINLAYEGGVSKRVLPLSGYGVLDPYRRALKDIVSERNPDDFDLKKSESLMRGKGYKKDREGFWASPDGERLSLNLDVPNWLRPIGPVVTKQLRDAGFDVRFRLYSTDMTTFFDSVRAGTSKLWIIVHGGSGRDPLGTLEHFHSKFSAPIGESAKYIWANSRYENPEYDRIIERLEMIPPSPKDTEYMKLTQEAVGMYLRDLPQIYIGDEMHVVTFSAHRWTGWASRRDPYVAPYTLWASFILEILKIKPVK